MAGNFWIQKTRVKNLIWEEIFEFEKNYKVFNDWKFLNFQEKSIINLI